MFLRRDGELVRSNARLPVTLVNVFRLEQRPAIVERFFWGTELDLGVLAATGPRRRRERELLRPAIRRF